MSTAPNDFDYDDVTIGKTLLDACRRRADHSEEGGLSSCLSSSVSHDGTVRPVVCPIDSQVSNVQETQRHGSESEQIATWTDSFLAVSGMASVVFFIQYIMVAVERILVELINFIKVKHL